MTDKKELDLTEHEKCIHYHICLVNNYIHNRCGYYLEKQKHGELDEFFKAFPELDIEPYNTWKCGADMRVKNELNRVSKELNSEIENSKSEIVPDTNEENK